jgi:hypothetical protein
VGATGQHLRTKCQLAFHSRNEFNTPAIEFWKVIQCLNTSRINISIYATYQQHFWPEYSSYLLTLFTTNCKIPVNNQPDLHLAECELSLPLNKLLKQLSDLPVSDLPSRHCCVCVCVRACLRACVCVYRSVYEAETSSHSADIEMLTGFSGLVSCVLFCFIATQTSASYY